MEKKHEHPHIHGHGHVHGKHTHDGHTHEHIHKEQGHGHSHEPHTHDGHEHEHRHSDHDHSHEHSHGHAHGEGHMHSHEHEHKYFSDIHADMASQFFGMPHRVPDTEEITGLRNKLETSTEDYGIIMALAESLSFQLRYREAIELYDRALKIRPRSLDALQARAGRHFKTLQFGKSLDDYVACDRISPDDREIIYRLGIVEYAVGINVEAESHFARCFDMYTDDPEMLVASAFWLALAESRTKSGAGLWKTYDFSLSTPHHAGYNDGLRVLAGIDSAEETYEKWREHEDKLQASIALYALVIHYRNEGDKKREGEIYSELMTTDEYWAGITYVAAFAERM